MPIYEYEPDGHDCLMCDGRVAAIQPLGEAPLKYCPDCGLDVKRIVSRFSSHMSKGNPVEKGVPRGFSTFRKLESGKWEKIAGENGPDSFERPAE